MALWSCERYGNENSLRFETSYLNYLGIHQGIHMYVASESHFHSLQGSSGLQTTSPGHPQIWNLWPQLPLVSICLLPLVAILVASEVMVASKWLWRTHLRSGLNSVPSITYIPMLLWPVKASLRWFTQTNKRGQLLTIELRSFACSQLKIVESASLTNLAHWP